MIHIKIITPLGLYLESDVDAIHVTTIEGERTLLPNHIPIVAMLKTSRLQLRSQSHSNDYAIAGGLLHMNHNQVNILTDAIEGKAEIDVERAKRAKERAEKQLAKKDNHTNLQRAEVALAKAINRIHVSKL